MKNIMIKLIGLFLVATYLFGCKKEDMNFKDTAVTPVKTLYSPVDNRAVKLLASASASLYF